MPFELPPLPYPHDALEPHIDARTMEIHHGKHHAAYVTNLNNALEAHPAWMGKPVEEIVRDLAAVPEAVRTAVRNNGGGHANHTMFWTLMGPGQGGSPKGDLAKAIDKSFNSFDAFRGNVGQGGHGAVRQRLGLAGRRQRRPQGRLDSQSGFAADRRA